MPRTKSSRVRQKIRKVDDDHLLFDNVGEGAVEALSLCVSAILLSRKNQHLWWQIKKSQSQFHIQDQNLNCVSVVAHSVMSKSLGDLAKEVWLKQPVAQLLQIGGQVLLLLLS